MPQVHGGLTQAIMSLTTSHRLVLPVDSNHHGTLYAGALMRVALEAAYATAFREIGSEANLVLRRVLSLECFQPVPVGTVIEIQGLVIHKSPAYAIVGLVAAPLPGDATPWMDGLLGFAQVDEDGKPTPLPASFALQSLPMTDAWQRLYERLQRLLPIRP